MKQQLKLLFTGLTFSSESLSAAPTSTMTELSALFTAAYKTAALGTSPKAKKRPEGAVTNLRQLMVALYDVTKGRNFSSYFWGLSCLRYFFLRGNHR